ncbi:MAG: glycosyltransferase [Anaerolineales bacterium]|nr:glycosyltransferase [Anaerolineales bacterium]MCX7755409.1 glycosyltransferase [Anaerolineales bacterium]MDW8278597.1 glycosyltransferase [Anaerolineales bacterium]
MMKPPQKPHILFLFSDTGGGHRSAAEAIIEALHLEFGDTVTTEMVDFLKEHMPTPINRLPQWYPYMVKLPQLWGASFRISDGRARARAITATLWPAVSRFARGIVNRHPSDLIVSVHPLATSFILRALGKNRPPFITVVTDMVTTHALWFDQRADLICVPTDIARFRAIEYGMEPEQVVTVGQPIAARYCVPVGDKSELRRKLGWPLDKFTAVLVGGGEGMGPLAQTARAINESGLDLFLAVVAGRNERLKHSLEEYFWNIPARIYGFTRDMPDFMRAADVLITKAGPGTIAEALNAHLPIILYAKLPGQEDGNVTYVRETGTGVWAPTPQRVVSTLREWIEQPERRQKFVEACKKAARPDSSRTIARLIGEKLGLMVTQ